MNHKLILLFLIMTSTVFISGCWNQKELNELAIISAMAIDKNEDGKYVKTIQLVNPVNVAGGLQGGGSGQSPTVTVYTAMGDSVLEAHFHATSKISRRLYHGHANLIVISEELATEEGIIDILDAFERDPEIRMTSRVVIARHTKAGDLLKSLTAIDKIPAEKVNGTIQSTERARGESMEVNLQDVVTTLTSAGKETVISGFSLIGDIEQGKKIENIQQSELNTTLESDGLAVFKEGKLVDWYQGEMSRGVVWILDKINQTDVVLGREGQKNALTYTVLRQKTRVSADTTNDLPVLTVRVRAEGDIREVRSKIDLTDPFEILDIEKELEKVIKKQLENTVIRTQQNKSDIFGFGEVVRRSDPEKWKKMKNDWNDTYFPNLKVNVKVEAFIRRSGNRTNSYLSDLEQ